MINIIIGVPVEGGNSPDSVDSWGTPLLPGEQTLEWRLVRLTVKDFFAAIGRSDSEGLLALAICGRRVGTDAGPPLASRALVECPAATNCKGDPDV
jgi:hypothetical protein